MVSNDVVRFTCICVEPPIGIEPMTYALRGCSRALLAGSKLALASCSQVAAGGDRWLLTAVRGHLGDTRPGGASPGGGGPPRWGREDPAASARDAGRGKKRGGEPIDAGSGAAAPGAGSSPSSRRPGARRLPVLAGARRPCLVIGAESAVVCRWVFTLPGAAPGDIPDDLVPGSGAAGSGS